VYNCIHTILARVSSLAGEFHESARRAYTHDRGVVGRVAVESQPRMEYVRACVRACVRAYRDADDGYSQQPAPLERWFPDRSRARGEDL
jgi:hypothetical protein